MRVLRKFGQLGLSQLKPSGQEVIFVLPKQSDDSFARLIKGIIVEF